MPSSVVHIGESLLVGNRKNHKWKIGCGKSACHNVGTWSGSFGDAYQRKMYRVSISMSKMVKFFGGKWKASSL